MSKMLKKWTNVLKYNLKSVKTTYYFLSFLLL